MTRADLRSALLSRRALALCTAAALAFACGPSFQVVYEGDARFEHCYAIDDTPTVRLEEKSECWTQWMKSYTYGQTRNKVDYAAMRAKALRDVPGLPTDEALMGAAPGGGTARSVAHDEPATTNAFAPPPKTLQVSDAGLDAPPEIPSLETRGSATPLGPTQTPREACTDRCRGQWQTCRGTCKARCGECDVSYGACMKGCF